MKSSHSTIEFLENRIAPAAVFTFTDVDGDLVKVTTSKGTNLQLADALTLVGGQLQKIDLTTTAFAGTNLTVAVTTRGEAGDGAVHVGFIDATGSTLGTVLVRGDLGKIVAGTAPTKAAVTSLTVNSIGHFGTTTGAPDFESVIDGGLGGLRVLGDVDKVYLRLPGKVGNIFIGGDLVGGSADQSGSIVAYGPTVGNVRIAGDVLGGDGFSTGLLKFENNRVGNITIDGNVEGTGRGGRIEGYQAGALVVGGDVHGGYIYISFIQGATIGGDLVGLDGDLTGSLHFERSTAPIKIGGNIIGGDGFSSGGLSFAGPSAQMVTVGGSIKGGEGNGSGYVYASNTPRFVLGGSLIGNDGETSGYIGLGRVGTMLIGGSINGGDGAFSGSVFVDSVSSLRITGDVSGNRAPYDPSQLLYFGSGQIRASSFAGTVDIGGDVSGSTLSFGGVGSSASAQTALQRLTVGGSVENSVIHAGLGTRADIKVGAVVVRGDWTASSLAVGTLNLGADDASGGAGLNADNLNFGDAHDVFAPIQLHISSIASIVIGGAVSGTPGGVNGTDHFGFVAGKIGTVRLGGFLVPLTPGAGNDNRSIGATGDVRIHELA